MLELRHIKRIYKRIKRDIQYNLQHENIARVFELIDTYADVSQRINDIFRDDDIEKWLEEIAEHYIHVTENESTTDCKKVIFYDQIGSTVCLSLQYIRALIANGYEILYIFESTCYSLYPTLRAELESHNIGIYSFNSDIRNTKTVLSLAKQVQKVILDFAPSKLIIHSPAFGAFGASVLYSLKGITRYRIVPGDHHFYIGYNCIDYFLEFRNFGIKVATEERHIDRKFIFLLPYYPIIDKFVDFQGFPVDIKNKICFAAAGAPYKFYGSDYFFRFSKWLLHTYDNCILFFIGSYTKDLKSFIEKEHLENQFIFLGYRKDFTTCIQNVDILINSYPRSGGLVCQTAAYFEKPIVSYTTDNDATSRSVRAILGAEKNDSSISFTVESELKKYVDNLIFNLSFRISEGKRVKSMLQTKENFDSRLEDILSNKIKPDSFVDNRTCNLDNRKQIYIQLQNYFLPTILEGLVKCYGVSLFWKIPSLCSFVMVHHRFLFKQFCANYFKKLPKFIQDAIREKFKKSL